jgi:hypothetical protein
MNRTTAAREVFLALGLIACGLIVLPAIVYLVGTQVVGPYSAGISGFYGAIGDALATGRAFAWLLILSPYLCFLLLRTCLWLRPSRQTVN